MPSEIQHDPDQYSADPLPKNKLNKKGGAQPGNGNALTHQLTSRTKLLPGESALDFALLSLEWHDEHQPQTKTALELVTQLVLADWKLRRAEHQINEMLAKFHADGKHMFEWDNEKFHRHELMERYKRQHERDVDRYRNALERLKRDELAEKHRRLLRKERKATRLAKAAADEAKKEAQQAAKAHTEQVKKEKNAPPPNPILEFMTTQRNESLQPLKDPSKKNGYSWKGKKGKTGQLRNLSQDIFLEIDDHGITTYKYYPTNEAMRNLGAQREPLPQRVLRRIHMLDNPPAEIDWVNEEIPNRFPYGGVYLQRMTIPTWLENLEREEQDPKRVPQKTSVPNLPREYY